MPKRKPRQVGDTSVNGLTLLSRTEELSPNHIGTAIPVYYWIVSCKECGGEHKVASCEFHHTTCGKIKDN